jgi:hypothetical protein
VSDSLKTQLDRGESVNDDLREVAIARVSREAEADMLLDMLGLGEVEAVDPLCPACRKPTPRSGICRRYERCRADREAGR